MQDLFYDICLEKYPQLFAEGHKPYKGPVANVTLLDTVFSTTECDPKKHKWLTNVTGVARSITHFLAKHECRGSFSPSMLKTHERIYATKSIKANNFPGLNTLLNTPLYVLAPKEYDCLSQLHLDGSHSDIAGRHSNSILGLPVLDHMLHEFDIAGVPFKKELAIAIRNKMTVSKLKLETGLLRWRVLSSIGQTTELFSPYSQLAKARNKHRQIAYRPHVSPNPMVLCDPTCGDLLFENARFFYASYADVKRVLHDILMRPHPTDATMDIIDLSTIVEAVAYVDNLENEVSTDGCLFYHRDAQIELNSFSLLDPSKNPCIPRNEQDIETNKQQNSDFETLVEKYYNEITAYNCVSHNKLSRSHLYKGSFDLNGITSNKFVWNNVKVLSRIHSEFMRTDTKTALLLEQMICKHFKISAIELNSLEDSFISVHPCP